MKILGFVLFLFLSNFAYAQEGTDPMALNSVVQEIVTGTGPVTKAQYDKFWAQLGATQPDQRAQMIDVMKSRFVFAQEYQREVWNCAEKAWNSKSVPQCPGAQNKLASLRAEMEKTKSESMLNPMIEYSDNLLKAAATRGSIKNPNGQGEVQVTLEMIKSTRSGLDQMLNRFSQILKTNY